MRVTLEATAGPGTGRKILLRTKQVARIGRTQLADYVFEDGYLSGVHFSVSFDGRECRVQDLGSSNGTFVNGQQVVEATLHSGDEIAAGGCRFRVAIDLTGPYRPPPPRPPAAEPSPANAAERPTSAAETPQERGTLPARGSPDPPSSPIPRFPTRTQPLLGRAAAEMPDRFARGLSDDDPDVRRAAMVAAVWTRAPWLLRHLIGLAGSPHAERLDHLRMFATLAEANHLSAILSLLRDATLGPERFELAGLCGHPAVVRDLLTAMSWDDAATTESGAAAFEKITGADLNRAEPAEAPPDGDPSAPSLAAAALMFWRREESRIARSVRWSRGRDVSRPVGDDVLQELDLESRWEVLLRDHFYRRREVSLREVELRGPVV